jgi:hypothetical protein
MKDVRTPRLGRELDESELDSVSGGYLDPNGNLDANDLPYQLRIRVNPAILSRVARVAGRIAGP